MIIDRDIRSCLSGVTHFGDAARGAQASAGTWSALVVDWETQVRFPPPRGQLRAASKASRQTRFQQPHSASAVEKLAATLRQPMTERLLKSADRLLKQEKDPERVKNLEILAQAWVEQKKVRIRYQGLKSAGVTNHVISPYLIEPSIWSDSVYVIAYSEVFEKVMPFKIDRIETAVLSGESFEISENFDDQQLLKHAWGIWYGDEEPITVKLRFTRDATRRVKESIWHPLEKVEKTEDGGCLWSADVAEWREMLPWVRGCGSVGA